MLCTAAAGQTTRGFCATITDVSVAQPGPGVVPAASSTAYGAPPSGSNIETWLTSPGAAATSSTPPSSETVEALATEAVLSTAASARQGRTSEVRGMWE